MDGTDHRGLLRKLSQRDVLEPHSSPWLKNERAGGKGQATGRQRRPRKSVAEKWGLKRKGETEPRLSAWTLVGLNIYIYTSAWVGAYTASPGGARLSLQLVPSIHVRIILTPLFLQDCRIHLLDPRS